MSERGCYGNNHFTRNVYGYGYALPYVGQEPSPTPSVPPALTPPAPPAQRASATQPTDWTAGGYTSVLGRLLVIATGAFVGYQLSPPGSRRDIAMALGATTATFFNILQRQANTLDRIADQQATTANRRLF